MLTLRMLGSTSSHIESYDYQVPSTIFQAYLMWQTFSVQHTCVTVSNSQN